MKTKLVALTAAAVLLSGSGAFGTYAYFTDAETIKDNVNITMGTLDTVAYWATDGITDWKATSVGGEVKDAGNGLAFENVKPGDKFERDIIVANKGTLRSNTFISLGYSFNGDAFDATIKVADKRLTGGDFNDQTNAGPGNTKGVTWSDMQVEDWVRLTVTIEAKPGLTNEWQKKVFTAPAKDFLTVTSEQLK